MTPPAEGVPPPRLIAWEVTRRCMLACKHCRASARAEPYPDELSTQECLRLLDNVASFAEPILILTGGEPMLRPDIYDIAAHATALGLRVVMAPCGVLIDDDAAAKILRSGIRHISVSLDGATAADHDDFRGVCGAFDAAVRGIAAARRAGLSFQVNTTVTKRNLQQIPAILDLAVRLGATVFNPFLLVPTGRGSRLADQEISPQQYEQTLRWLAAQEQRDDIAIRVTCAPHYQRVVRQLGLRRGLDSRYTAIGASAPGPVKGCMGGQSFAFISHRGKVQICGFLDVECGDVRAEGLDFRKIWETSEVFRQVRDVASYGGRCGRCEFAAVCGGCRARAYALTGDYLAEEPFCTYQPRTSGSADDGGRLTKLDQAVLSVIQTAFPVAEQPFEALADQLGAAPEEVRRCVLRLRDSGVIRRVGAVFDSRRLGYASTLVAARVPPERLDEVAAMASRLPGVTHNYGRDHAYNLWFTLTAESERRLEEAIDDLKRRSAIPDLHSLPALAVYKIRVNFRFGQAGATSDDAPPVPSAPAGEAVALSDEQKQLVRLIQGDLPIVAEPFAESARRLGWPVRRVLAQIDDWLAAGVIRRLGAVVRHRRLGLQANGMAVFRVPEGSNRDTSRLEPPPHRIDDVGISLARRPDVSHCYRRPPLPDFPYNLFAMFHGRSPDQVRAAAAAAAAQHALDDHLVLFSTTEYKKTSMRYFEEAPDP